MVLDALIDLPFALPTAVAGIALPALYAPNGWKGSLLARVGVHAAFNRLGILLALDQSRAEPRICVGIGGCGDECAGAGQRFIAAAHAGQDANLGILRLGGKWLTRFDRAQ